MKKFFIVFLLSFVSFISFAQDLPKGQIMQFNEKANEEIIVINNSFKDAFKISIHTTDSTSFHLNAFSASLTNSEEGWMFLVKTPELKCNEKWKSSSDFEFLEHADYICIESKSGRKYNYTFETKRDKLYITVNSYKEGDDW